MSVVPMLGKARRFVAEIILSLGSTGFLFTMIVESLFERGDRPRAPDPDRGFTSLVHNKFGFFYGTQYEHFAVTAEFEITFALFVAGFLISADTWTRKPNPAHYPWTAGAVAAASIAIQTALLFRWIAWPDFGWVRQI